MNQKAYERWPASPRPGRAHLGPSAEREREVTTKREWHFSERSSSELYNPTTRNDVADTKRNSFSNPSSSLLLFVPMHVVFTWQCVYCLVLLKPLAYQHVEPASPVRATQAHKLFTHRQRICNFSTVAQPYRNEPKTTRLLGPQQIYVMFVQPDSFIRGESTQIHTQLWATFLARPTESLVRLCWGLLILLCNKTRSKLEFEGVDMDREANYLTCKNGLWLTPQMEGNKLRGEGSN